MKRIFTKQTAWLVALLLVGFTSYGQNTITTPRATSPAAEVSQTIGISKVNIAYSRPFLRGREGKIWGQLVPYGYTVQGFGNGKEIPWRAGANENTIITFSDDVKVEGQDLAAGSYGLHIAIFENGDADVIFSTNTSSWGSFWYEESEDALRVKVKTEEIPTTEVLTYDFVNLSANSATAVLDWEKKRIPFKIEFDVHNLVIQNAKNQLRSTQGFGYQGPMSAAQYCVQNNVALDQALIWADQAIGIQKNANTLNVKGQVLFASNKNDEAYAIMEEMTNHPTATPNDFYGYGNTLIGKDENQKALDLFKKMDKKWENNPFAQHGMARAYSGLGNFKKALEYERACLNNPNLPPNNKPFLEAFIKRLEAGEDIN